MRKFIRKFHAQFSYFGDNSIAQQLFRSSDFSLNMVTITNFEDAYLDETTADVFFLFKSSAPLAADSKNGTEEVIERVPAHKIILGVTCTVFRNMFYGGLKSDEIEIKEATCDAFKQFLHCFYCTKPTLTLNHVGEVLKLAKRYMVPSISEVCFNWLDHYITTKDVMYVYELAIHYKNPAVAKKCEPFIVSTDQLSSDEFMRSSVETLESVVAIPTLSSKRKFKAAMEWSRNKCLLDNIDPEDMEKRRQAMGECFKSIDFETMHPKELLDCIESNETLFHFDELCTIFKAMLKRFDDALTIRATNQTFKPASNPITSFDFGRPPA